MSVLEHCVAGCQSRYELNRFLNVGLLVHVQLEGLFRELQEDRLLTTTCSVNDLSVVADHTFLHNLIIAEKGHHS